ncbi:hypothetical protein pipiens_005820, partial [Culex pipiens pipiens]
MSTEGSIAIEYLTVFNPLVLEEFCMQLDEFYSDYYEKDYHAENNINYHYGSPNNNNHNRSSNNHNNNYNRSSNDYDNNYNRSSNNDDNNRSSNNYNNNYNRSPNNDNNNRSSNNDNNNRSSNNDYNNRSSNNDDNNRSSNNDDNHKSSENYNNNKGSNNDDNNNRTTNNDDVNNNNNRNFNNINYKICNKNNRDSNKYYSGVSNYLGTNFDSSNISIDILPSRDYYNSAINNRKHNRINPGAVYSDHIVNPTYPNYNAKNNSDKPYCGGNLNRCLHDASAYSDKLINTSYENAYDYVADNQLDFYDFPTTTWIVTTPQPTQLGTVRPSLLFYRDPAAYNESKAIWSSLTGIFLMLLVLFAALGVYWYVTRQHKAIPIGRELELSEVQPSEDFSSRSIHQHVNPFAQRN